MTEKVLFKDRLARMIDENPTLGEAMEELAKKKKEYKQVIVMRTDLNMRKGKMVAQGAHASLRATLLYMHDPRVTAWLAGPFAKICVQVPSEKALMEVYDMAWEAGLPVALITDAGRTEFNGVPTVTCCAVGPDVVEVVDRFTGHLKLL